MLFSDSPPLYFRHNQDLLHYKIRYFEGQVYLNHDEKGAEGIQKLIQMYINKKIGIPTRSWKEQQSQNLFTMTSQTGGLVEPPPLPQRPKGGYVNIKAPLNIRPRSEGTYAN